MNNIIEFIFMLLLSVVVAVRTTAQEYKRQEYNIVDTSLYAQDVIFNDDQFYVLSARLQFNSLIPVEGSLAYGSVLMVIDEDLSLDWIRTYQNSFVDGPVPPSTGALGRSPADFLLLDSSETILLPYDKHYGYNACNSSMTTFSQLDRIGLMHLSSLNGSIENDFISTNLSPCETPDIYGGFIKEDHQALVITSQSNQRQLLFYNVDIDRELSLIKESTTSYWPVKNGYTLLNNGQIQAVGSDLQNEGWIVTHYSFEGDSLWSKRLITDLRLRKVVNGLDNQTVLLADKWLSGIYYSEIVVMDYSANIQWQKDYFTSYYIVDIVTINNGYLILSKLTDINSQGYYEVGLLSREGNLITTKRYDELFDTPIQIISMGGLNYGILGNHQKEDENVFSAPSKLFLTTDGFESTTSVDNVAINQSISIHPNPTNTNIKIEIPDHLNDTNSPCKVVLIDFSGKIMRSTHLTHPFILDTEFLIPGFYYLTIYSYDGDLLLTEKLIKSL